jgi:hypothetical protein
MPSSADLHNLPSHLDVAALMEHVLAAKPREEEIDDALRRVLQQEHPEAAQALFNVFVETLRTQQRMFGITRLQAVTQLANAKSEMNLSPEGKPEITSIRVQAEGLENLSLDQREQVLHELESAVRTGQPLPKRIQMITKGESEPSSRLVVVGAILLAATLAAIYSVAHLLSRG